VEKRILLVEDDAAFREVFARALGKALASEHLDVAFVEAGMLAEASVPPASTAAWQQILPRHKGPRYRSSATHTSENAVNAKFAKKTPSTRSRLIECEAWVSR
jgi:hypothetical protein